MPCRLPHTELHCIAATTSTPHFLWNACRVRCICTCKQLAACHICCNTILCVTNSTRFSHVVPLQKYSTSRVDTVRLTAGPQKKNGHICQAISGMLVLCVQDSIHMSSAWHKASQTDAWQGNCACSVCHAHASETSTSWKLQIAL